MTLHSPFIISARLLPAIAIGEAAISIEFAGRTNDGRTRYRYFIDLPDGTEHQGTDLKSGVGGGSIQEGMENLLGFLSACGESFGYRQRTGRESENEDLFPPSIAEWAYQNSDELSMLALELEENSDLITQ